MGQVVAGLTPFFIHASKILKMRPVTLTVGVLVREAVNDNAWPGVDESVNFNDAACPSVDGDSPSFLIEQGFVVMGFDASASDSFPAPDGWQYFNQAEASALIPGWAAALLEWHPATKITCSNNPDNFWIVSNNFFDVVSAFTVCCGAAEIPTLAMALKQSTSSLNPDEANPPCGTLAAFKFLAIRGSSEIQVLMHRFVLVLKNADESISLEYPLPGHNDDPLPGTTQAVLNWPEDFIGLTMDGKTLVANDVTPGVDEYNVSEFDNGTIEMTTTIRRVIDEVIVSEAVETFRLPGTDCIPEPDPGPEIMSFNVETFGEEWIFSMDIVANASHTLNVDWGDGSEIETFTGIVGTTNISHAFDGNELPYNVKIYSDNGLNIIQVDAPTQNITGFFNFNTTLLPNLSSLLLAENLITQMVVGCPVPYVDLSYNNLTGTHQVNNGNVTVLLSNNGSLIGVSGSSTSCETLDISNCGLTDLGMFYFNSNGGWPTPNLVTLNISGNPALNTAAMQTYLPLSIEDVRMNEMSALDLAEVNGALIRLAGGVVNNGFFSSITGTVAPNGAGLAAKTTLQGRGWTVNTT